MVTGILCSAILFQPSENLAGTLGAERAGCFRQRPKLFGDERLADGQRPRISTSCALASFQGAQRVKPSIRILSAAMALAAVSGAALAAQSAADVIHARQAGYKQLGSAFKGLHDQLVSSSPDKVQIAAYARRINEIAPQIQGWFPKGSGPEAGVKTRAKPAIWQRYGEFQADAKALAAETARLAAVAPGGDVGAIKAQFKAVGDKCGACHTAFREKE
jgi:cytochrome c556